MKPALNIVLQATLIVAVGLLGPALGLSQDSPTTKQDADADNGPAGDNAQAQTPESMPADQPPIPAAREDGIIRALGKAKPLSGPAGPLTWGWLSVRSADFREFYDQTALIGAPPLFNDNMTATMLATSISLDRPSKRAHFALQYEPTIFISRGTVFNDMNQQLGLDTTFQLSERWSFTGGDRLSYLSSNRVFAGLAFDVDYVTGATVQENFLDGPGTLFYDALDLGFAYLWSPRTIVAFGPAMGYQRATGALSSGALTTAVYEGGTFKLTHILDATKTLGFSYTGQNGQFATQGAAGGPNGNEFLQDALVTYSQEISPTWHLTLGAGVTDDTGPGAAGLGLGVNAGIAKKFHWGEFGGGYERGNQFVGLVTGQVTDRVDAIQRFFWTKRLTTATSAAYFRTTGGAPSYSGLYGLEEVSWGLTRRVSIVADAGYVRQMGDGVFVLNGHRVLCLVGLHWEAVPAEHH